MMCVLSSKEKLNFLSHIQSTILIDNWFIRRCVFIDVYTDIKHLGSLEGTLQTKDALIFNGSATTSI